MRTGFTGGSGPFLKHSYINMCCISADGRVLMHITERRLFLKLAEYRTPLRVPHIIQ